MSSEPLRGTERRKRLDPGPLTGRLLRPARIPPARLVILLIASGAVFLLGSAGFLSRWSQKHAEVGVVWSDAPGGVQVSVVEPGGSGDQARLQEGDRLVAIGGEPVASALDAEDRLWLAEPGSRVPVTLERGGRSWTVLLEPAAAREDLRLYTYLSLVGLLFLVLGTILSLRVRLGGVGVPYFLLGLVVFVLLAFSPSGRGDWFDWALYWGDQGARVLVVPVFLHFCLSFARQRRPLLRRVLIPLLYVPAAALLAFDLWLVAGGAVYRFVEPVLALEARDRIELGYLGLGLAAGMLILSVSYLRSKQERVRRPLKWLLWGAIVGLGPFVCLYLIPAALGLRISAWSEVSALPLLVVPLCFAFAVARYRLTDLELFFKRGVATGILAGCLVGVYLGGDIVFRRLVPDGADGLPEVLALLLAALLLPRLRLLIHTAIDRLFYQDRYDYRRTLQEFGTELNRERELGPLVAKLADRVARTLGVEPVTVLLPAGPDESFRPVYSTPGDAATLELPADSPLARSLAWSGPLDLEDLRDPRADAAPAERFEEASLRYLVPLTVQGSLVALLALGPRRDGAPLNTEDRELLEAVARHAAMAVQGARLFEEMRNRAGEIERLKDFNERILERSHVGILVLQSGRTVVGWNRSLAELTGIQREMALGRPLGEVLDAGFCRLVNGALQEARGAVVRLYRQPLQGAEGEARLVNLGLSPLHSSGGDADWVVTVDDVTEEVEREEALAQQERLASVGLLASGVAHEVNTPLTGISSFAQMLLEETPATDPRYPLLKKIEQQSFRASEVANRLLNFSRPDHLEFVLVDLNDAVEETLSLFEPQIRGSRVFVRRELDESLAPVRGQRGKLQQVLLNLLLNAQDALKEGGEISVRTFQAGAHVRLEVRDNGDGIRSEHLSRIYDPFFTTKRHGKGTGLGLSITYGIVQEHSGTIGVESRVGEGTCFSILLPRAREERAAAY